MRAWLQAWAACVVAAVGQAGCATVPAPRPLYDDPAWHGAADAALVYHRGLQRWEMFYTACRATLRLDDPKDVSWVHGTRIGIAAAPGDGNIWHHVGEAEFPEACTGGAPEQATHWAPEIVDDGSTYHLWLTVVPGVHSRWTGARHLQHLTSPDLRDWQCEARLDASAGRLAPRGPGCAPTRPAPGLRPRETLRCTTPAG